MDATTFAAFRKRQPALAAELNQVMAAGGTYRLVIKSPDKDWAGAFLEIVAGDLKHSHTIKGKKVSGKNAMIDIEPGRSLANQSPEIIAETLEEAALGIIEDGFDQDEFDPTITDDAPFRYPDAVKKWLRTAVNSISVKPLRPARKPKEPAKDPRDRPGMTVRRKSA